MSAVTDILKRYLVRKEDVDLCESGCRPYVTISRQDGVEGHELGREIIRRLDALPDDGWNRGWELFDQKLCAMLVAEGQLDASFDSLLAEKYQSGIRQMVYEMFVGRSEEWANQKKIAEVIRFLLTYGRVVVIGRGGMCLTRGLPLGINLRLMAPDDVRLARVMEERQLDAAAARRSIREREADRARLIRDFYGQNIDNPHLYHAVFATERLTRPEMARAVVEMLRERMRMRESTVRHEKGRP